MYIGKRRSGAFTSGLGQEREQGAPGSMDDCPVLDIGEGSHSDVVEITAQDTAVPNTGLHRQKQYTLSARLPEQSCAT